MNWFHVGSKAHMLPLCHSGRVGQELKLVLLAQHQKLFDVNNFKISRLWELFEQKCNKTAGCRWHIFCPLILIKMLCKRMEVFFQNTVLFIVFSKFSKFKNFLIFSPKTLQLTFRRYFKEIMFIDTHSTSNLLFFQKSRFFNVLRDLNTSVTFIPRQVCYNLVVKNFQGQKVSESEIGHYELILIVKNVSFDRFEWTVFLPCFKYGGKNWRKNRWRNSVEGLSPTQLVFFLSN